MRQGGGHPRPFSPEWLRRSIVAYAGQRNLNAHPEVIGYTADALWSINERLAQREGLDLPRLGNAYLSDWLHVAEREAEDAERLEGEMETERRKLGLI